MLIKICYDFIIIIIIIDICKIIQHTIMIN